MTRSLVAAVAAALLLTTGIAAPAYGESDVSPDRDVPDTGPDGELPGDADVPGDAELPPDRPEVVEVDLPAGDGDTGGADTETRADPFDDDIDFGPREAAAFCPPPPGDCGAGNICVSDVCLPRVCRRDAECPRDYVCRDDGICVPERCRRASDCLYPDFYCRADNRCAPAVCVFDTDCTRYQFCDAGACAQNLAVEVIGRGGCAGGGPAVLLIALAAAAAAVARRSRA